MEEIIAKSVRTMYIVTYSICIGLGAFVFGGGGILILLAPEEASMFGWFFMFLGLVLIGASIAWLVYFCKMPKNAVTFRDGKLYFRNGTICSPAEVDLVEAKFMNLDGEMFNFGKLFVTVRGVQFKLKFVANARAAANRIYMLKSQYTGVPYPMYGQPVPPQVNNQYPMYGQPVPPQMNNQYPVYGQPVPPQVNNQPVAAEQPVQTAETTKENNQEENNG